MNVNDFKNGKMYKCVKNDGHSGVLTIGEQYKVVGSIPKKNKIEVKNDKGYHSFVSPDRFQIK